MNVEEVLASLTLEEKVILTCHRQSIPALRAGYPLNRAKNDSINLIITVGET